MSEHTWFAPTGQHNIFADALASNRCQPIIKDYSVTLTYFVNFLVCGRFSGAHVAVLPFLKFIVARESFWRLKFQLFPTNGSGFMLLPVCLCWTDEACAHLRVFATIFVQLCRYFRFIWPHSVSFSTWKLCLPIPNRKLCCYSFFAMVNEQIGRHFRSTLKCVCSVIIPSFLSFLPWNW